MRVHVQGTRGSGEPIAAEVELPDTIRVGDTFVLGAGGEHEREVEIVGMERGVGADGVAITTVIVAPISAYGWEEHEEQHRK